MGGPAYSNNLLHIALTYLHFVLIRGRLYRVSCETCMEEKRSQLLVTKSCREIIFKVAYHNLMAGEYDKTLEQLMAHFYWPGIRENVGTSYLCYPRSAFGNYLAWRSHLSILALDFIGPLHRNAREYHFVLVLVNYAV